MVTDGKNKSISEFFAEIVVQAVVPVSEGSLDGTIDVGIVPQEVVGDSLGKGSAVSKDGEEFAELGEVIGDATTVVDGGREVLKEFADVHDAMGDAH